MLEIKWITDNIAVSPAFKNEDLAELRQLGIDAIVDLRLEARDDPEAVRCAGMEFFRTPILDTFAPDLSQVKAIMEFVNPLLDRNKRILVHCQHGYGRSPLVAVAILIKRGMPAAEARKILEQRHPVATFSIYQEKFFKKLAAASEK